MKATKKATSLVQEMLHRGVTLERINKIRRIANLYAKACIHSECSLCCLLEQVEGIKVIWEKLDNFGANEQQALILMRHLDVGKILTIFTRRTKGLIPIFAAFHELGHYCLKHYTEQHIVFGDATEIQEIEASYFAFIILAIAQHQSFDNVIFPNFHEILKGVSPVFFPFVVARSFFTEEIGNLGVSDEKHSN